MLALVLILGITLCLVLAGFVAAQAAKIKPEAQRRIEALQSDHPTFI